MRAPEAKAAYKAAVGRFREIVLMERKPDRAPIFVMGTFLPLHLYAVTPYEAMYDTDKMLAAQLSFLKDYKPDYNGGSPALIGYGKVFDILDYKQYRLPGHGISKTSVYQYVEGEYMLADEYPALIHDPSDFWIRTLMPRVYGPRSLEDYSRPLPTCGRRSSSPPRWSPLAIRPSRGPSRRCLMREMKRRHGTGK